MPERVEILSRRDVFQQAIFRIEEARLRHERFDGSMSDEIMRLKLDRGNGVTAILHNPADDTVILTEQFRYPTYDNGPGWLLELPAGMVDAGENPADTMRRELVEEVGYAVETLIFICGFYPSPGGTSERIDLYYASVHPANQVNDGGGKDDESEDIRTVIMPADDAIAKIATGEIIDAKTIIGLQWLQLQRLGK
jgi:nudix-type nucleoside diphosphatase (YffH/AdpP family)